MEQQLVELMTAYLLSINAESYIDWADSNAQFKTYGTDQECIHQALDSIVDQVSVRLTHVQTAIEQSGAFPLL